MRQAGQLPVADLRPSGRSPRMKRPLRPSRVTLADPFRSVVTTPGISRGPAGARPLGTGPAAPNAPALRGQKEGHMAEPTRVAAPIGGDDKIISFETGKLAGLAGGAVMAGMGDTRILVTATGA